VQGALAKATAPATSARWWWVLGVPVAVGFVATGLWLARAPVLSAVGGYLVVEDPLQPAAAIIVLDGGVPFREAEAARLYLDGWAPRVVMTRGPDGPISRAQTLEQLGVPASAIEVVDERPSGTLGELELLAGAVGLTDGPVLLVTSPYHTRRAGLAWWRATNGRVHGIVRAAWQEAFDAQTWWHQPQLRLRAWHEYVGLVASLVGLRGD
jgi:uncharacterized SAM-binding protein YcdF (DUF218 family)